MQALLALLKTPRILAPLFLLGGAGFIFSGTHPHPFSTTDPFVLLATEQLTLEQDTQVSSGNLGSNETLALDKDVLVTGDLFGKTITLDKGTTINGNASYNKLKTHKEAQILGIQTKPVQLPIANLPEIPSFDIGMQDITFSGTSTVTTLSSGNYRDIVLEKNSRLVLTGGIYNIRKLELKENSTLIFNAETTINIQFKLRGYDGVAIFPSLNIKPDDLTINYVGISLKSDNSTTEDDDGGIDVSFDDGSTSLTTSDKEKKDHKAGKIGRPALFGEHSFLNFRLTAPKASVTIGKDSTLRGQVLAKKIKIKKDSVVSKEEDFLKDIDPARVVENQGTRFVVNEILLLISDTANINDINWLIKVVSGKIVGVVDGLGIIKVEIPSSTVSGQQQAVTILKNLNSPLIEEVIPNFLFN